MRSNFGQTCLFFFTPEKRDSITTSLLLLFLSLTLLGEINKLEANKSKRANKDASPVYLVIKRLNEAEDAQEGQSAKQRDFAPKVIWVTSIDDIKTWIGKELPYSKGPALKMKDAKHAFEFTKEQLPQNQDEYLDNLETKNVSDLDCVLLFY